MSLADRDGHIWFNGELVPWRDAKVHVLTHTLHYGMGVFEGVRAYQTPERGGCIFRLHDHTRRLFDSAHILGIEVPYSLDDINAAQCLVMCENGLEEGYLRPLVFLGSEAMGLRAEQLSVNVAVACWEWPSYMDEGAQEQGIAVRTSSYTRHHVNISMCKAKTCGNYVNSMMALREAISGGADEALMLDNEGYVAEGSGENIFMVRNGRLYTPDLASCLDGITRRTVIALAQESGLQMEERRITRDELYIADEVFFSGTAAEIVPVRELDGRRIADGRRGEMTGILQQQYFDLVRGHLSVHCDWLTPVAP